MILKSVLFLLPTLALGQLFVFWFWPGSLSDKVLLKTGLGIITGMGIHGILTTWGLLFFGISWQGLLGLEGFFILILAALCGRKFKGTGNLLKKWKRLNVYQLGFAILFFINALTFISFTFLKPMGNFDAYAIWNLKAKMIFLNPIYWPQALNHSAIIFFHPDYPLMLPALVSDLWLKIGVITSRAPMVVAALFTLCLPLLLYAVVQYLRDDSQAFLAGSLMLAAPYLFQFGSGQTADVPLAVYGLAAVILFVLALMENHWQFFALSGLMAGFAGWTKNEGLMFIGVLLVLLIFVFLLPKRSKKLSPFVYWIAGVLIPVVTILVFKSRMTFENDLFSGSILERIRDWSRTRKLWWVLAGNYSIGEGGNFPSCRSF